jgi:uncharacterized protein (DUF983 family)
VGEIQTTLPHAAFGASDCCGCLNGVTEGDKARIECNKCGAVLATVPAADLGRTFTKMELVLDLASALCPHCDSVNLFPGFSRVIAFNCQQCGLSVDLSASPATE